MDLQAFGQLAIALGLGLLVGLEREWTSPHVAGIRTFALITVFGTVAGQLAEEFSDWLVPAGLLVIAVMVVVGSWMKFRAGETEAGLTTQVAAVLMYGVGVLLASDQREVAVTVGGGVAVLLHWKQPLHALVQRIGEEDIRAIVQLVLLALVILPVVPNKTFGPYAVLNPLEIWLMVVLITGINVMGYMAYKFLGPQVGMLLAGVIGGIISSTATTVSYARRSRSAPQSVSLAAIVVGIASAVVFVRILIEIAVVSPHIVPKVFLPLMTVMAVTGFFCACLYLGRGKETQRIPLEESPADLQTAVLFGVLYGAVIFAIAAAKDRFGEQGLYTVAALSGLAQMDAVTLSTAQLMREGTLAVDSGWRMILTGALTNMVLKGVLVACFGHRQMTVRVALVLGLSLICGAAVLLFWPPVG